MRGVAGHGARNGNVNAALRGTQHFLTRAVIHGYEKRHTRVVARFLPRLGKCVTRLLRQHGDVAYRAHTHVFGMQAVNLSEHGFGEQVHQTHDFFFGTFPVFRRERINGKEANARVARRANELANRRNASLVAFQAIERTLFRPAAIAVHDDGDMLRHGVFAQSMRIEPGGRVREHFIYRFMEHVSSFEIGPTRVLQRPEATNMGPWPLKFRKKKARRFVKQQEPPIPQSKTPHRAWTLASTIRAIRYA